jgi:hypothetical protein
MVVTLLVAAATLVLINHDAPEAPALGQITAREAQTGHGTSSTAGSSASTAATSLAFDGCSTKPAPPGRVEAPSAGDGAAAAAALVADYRFRGSLASSVEAAPDLVQVGSGTSRFANESVRGRTRPVLRLGRGRGLSLAPTAGVIASGAFTIELEFRLRRLAGYRKLLDFKKASDDSGLYSLDGCLNLYPRRPASPATIGTDTYVQVVLTRDASARVVGYVDGIRQFSFHDPGRLAVIDGRDTLQFFRDDSETNTESSGGAVSRIRLFDRPLVGSEVAALACVDLPAWFCS